MKDNTEQRLNVAIEAARAAAVLIDWHFSKREDFSVHKKKDLTPVTEADQNAEKLILEKITKHFPNDGILGEEHGEKRGNNDWRWIIDPIDGTKSFIHGVGQFGTLIALQKSKEFVLGVACFPAAKELVYALKGSGCFWHQHIQLDPEIKLTPPVRAKVSQVSELQDALLCFTAAERIIDLGKSEGFFYNFIKQFYINRSWGDCWGHALVATGRAEVMFDPGITLWDWAPFKVIVEEAGGVFGDFTGELTEKSRMVMSTNRVVYEPLKLWLQKNL